MSSAAQMLRDEDVQDVIDRSLAQRVRVDAPRAAARQGARA